MTSDYRGGGASALPEMRTAAVALGSKRKSSKAERWERERGRFVNEGGRRRRRRAQIKCPRTLNQAVTCWG